MSFSNIALQGLAVGTGAACGAWLRWGLSIWLNPLSQVLAIGTLVANIVGGFLIGAAFAWFQYVPKLDPIWRLLITTGCLGGLTTFSTFSLESFQYIQASQYMAAFLHGVLHCVGSLLMTWLGFWVVKQCLA